MFDSDANHFLISLENMMNLPVLTLVCFILFKTCLCDDLKPEEGCKTSMRLFGPNKQYRCNCENVNSCDFKNQGRCTDTNCRYPFLGPYCQLQRINTHFQWQSELTEIKWKSIRIRHCGRLENVTVFVGSQIFCEFRCSRMREMRCTGSITGRISVPGRYLYFNAYGCMPFWFGEECEKQCHCAQNSECHAITGICPLGCDNGWSGTDCQDINFAMDEAEYVNIPAESIYDTLYDIPQKNPKIKFYKTKKN